MRGERPNPFARAKGESGSSPHARGTQNCTANSTGSFRIIPACAGNAALPVIRTPLTPDHPRMRGERSTPVASAMSCSGSSPHARGTREEAPKPILRHRIIPACAGNARSARASGQAVPDHPRMRGERDDTVSPQIVTGGSSPHARGTLLRQSREELRGRIIPACAGNANPHSGDRGAEPDHPRMRGERGRRLLGRACWVGSSPHARGTHGPCNGQCDGWRIIPACAGNAWCGCPKCGSNSDHPRMRGERHDGELTEQLPVGSSPHARGTLCHS